MPEIELGSDACKTTVLTSVLSFFLSLFCSHFVLKPHSSVLRSYSAQSSGITPGKLGTIWDVRDQTSVGLVQLHQLLLHPLLFFYFGFLTIAGSIEELFPAQCPEVTPVCA